jgi:excisionase family DNA binding protein
MRDRILAEPTSWTWITVADAARVLQVSRFGVHYLVRSGQLPHERTWRGQWLFRYGVVKRLAEQRAATRMLRPADALAAVRVRMLKAHLSGEAQQLRLDFCARLRLVGRRHRGVKVA